MFANNEAFAELSSPNLQPTVNKGLTDLLNLRKAAESGDSNSQFNLGYLYEVGRGLPQDDAEAAKWYRKAANNGFVPTQWNLGAAYLQKRGVPQNSVDAYMWFSLASPQISDQTKPILDGIKKVMTPDQIAEAERGAAEWKPLHVPYQSDAASGE